MENNTIQKFIQERILSPQGKLFPMAQQMLPTQGQGAIDLARQMAIGATVSPVDAQSTRIIRDILKSRGQLNIPQTGKLLDIAKRNLNIPTKMMNRLSDERIIAEILGLLQKKR